MQTTEYLPSTRRRLVAVDRPATTELAVRIRAIAPWNDGTAAVVIDTIRARARAGATFLVDLSDCSAATTTQLAVLIAAVRAARATRASLLVAGPPALRRLAGICGVEDLLTWDDAADVEEADAPRVGLSAR